MEEQPIERVEKDSTGISMYVSDLFQEFRNGRRPYEDKAEEWWNNFLSQYQSTKTWRNKEGEGNRSRIFIKVTQQKCYTAHAKVMDALGSDVPFELGALENLNYDDIPPEVIEEAARFRRSYIADYLKYIKFFDTLDDSVLDATIFPAAIIKGPILITDKQPVVQRRMIAGIPAEQMDPRMSPFMVTTESVEKYIFETVPFWDYYVDVNSKNTRRSIGEIQYKRMLPQEFRELKDDPGYDQAQMTAAIANIDLIKSDFPDMDKDKTNKQSGDKFMGFEVIKDSKIPVVEFHGLIKAELIRAFGSDVPENIDSSEDCEACVVMVDDGKGTVIKARYNYYGYRPFMVFGVKKIPNSVYKHSIAGLMDDSQSMINSGARLFIDGKALSGNGCLAVHNDKIDWLKTGTAAVYPRKTYYLKGNATVKDAIDNVTFPDVTLGIKDMVQMFMQIADEETGIPKYTQGEGSASSYLNKMLDINTPVPMANGSYKLLSDIVDGDMILGSNGLPTRVVSAHLIHYPEKAYRMKFESGEEIVAGGEHLWSVLDYNGKTKVHTTDELFTLKRKWYIPMIGKDAKQQILSIKTTKICKMRCLTVDAKDGLFCVGKRFTITHNTATGISMIMGAANVNLKPFLKNIDDNVIEPVVERLDALFSMMGKYPPQFNIPLKISATGTISMMARELIVENMIKLLQITQNPQDAMIIRRREILLAMAEKLGLSKFVKSEQEIQRIEAMMAERQARQPIQADAGVAVDKLFPSLTPFEQGQILQSVGLQPDPRRMQGFVPELPAPPPEAQAPYNPAAPQPQPGGPQ